MAQKLQSCWMGGRVLERALEWFPMNRGYRNGAGGGWEGAQDARIRSDRHLLFSGPGESRGEGTNVAIAADVPIGPRTYRAEFVTVSPVVPGEAWPPGSWRVRVDDAWVPMPKAPPPRQGRQDVWEVALVPHVRGAMRRATDERHGGF